MLDVVPLSGQAKVLLRHVARAPTGDATNWLPSRVEVPARRPRRAITVYECPQCESRYLGEQRCEDCGVFCRRIGFGAPWPHCDEPVAMEDLMTVEAPGA